MHTDDHADFSELMQAEGVRPLPGSQRAALRRGDIPDAQTLDARREAATLDTHQGPFAAPELPDPFAPLAWKRDGVQGGVYRQLRLGKYTPDARLDLFRVPVRSAYRELQDFIEECQRLGIRTVMLNHGRPKGRDCPANQKRAYIEQWLRGHPKVMAFHSTPQQHGGLGSLYILLFKNERQRLDNWEQHQKR